MYFNKVLLNPIIIIIRYYNMKQYSNINNILMHAISQFYCGTWVLAGIYINDVFLKQVGNSLDI